MIWPAQVAWHRDVRRPETTNGGNPAAWLPCSSREVQTALATVFSLTPSRVASIAAAIAMSAALHAKRMYFNSLGDLVSRSDSTSIEPSTTVPPEARIPA